MVQPRYQPQGAARLERRNKFTANAIAVLNAAHNTNLVTNKPLVAAGAGFLKSGLPAGLAWSFRRNFYVETEALPAIGTGSFVEFWLGYPSSDLYARGSNSAPGMLTGHSANQIGIAGSVGTNSANVGTTNSTYWGAVYNWPTLTNAGESLTPGKLTLLLVVRRQSGTEFWRDGQMVRFVSQAPTNVPAGTMICGSFVEDTAYWSASADTLLAGRVLTPVEPTADEIKQFSANPWRLFSVHHDVEDVAAASTAISPEPAPFTVAGFAPTVVRGITTSVVPGAAGLSVTGFAPSVTQGLTKTISPAPASMAVTGYAPAVSQTAARAVSPGPAALAITGYPPTISRGASQTIPAGAAVTPTMRLTGYAPSISQANNVTPHMYDATIMRLSAVRAVADLGPDRIQQAADLL